VLRSNGDAEPMDLLDANTSRRMLKGNAPGARQNVDDYARSSDGRMIIREEAPPPGIATDT